MPAAKLDRALHRGRRMVLRWFSPGEVSRKWNTWNLYREIAWYGVFSGVTATFTSTLALRLGGSDLLVGLLTSLPALANIICQIPAARLIGRQRNLRNTILVSGFLLRLPAFLIALVPFLLGRFQAGAVVCIVALGNVPAAVSSLAFTTMIADVVAPRDRLWTCFRSPSAIR